MFKKNQKIKLHQTPEFSSFSVKRNIRFRGYIVELNWNYNCADNNVEAFKIFKFKSSVPLLEKNYFITQAAAESLSGMYSISSDNNILYDKRLFSKNSKVDIFGEASASVKQESPVSQIDFKNIGFVKASKKTNTFKFVDKNVIFGETYVYAICAIRKDFLHSAMSKEMTVSIEDIEHPQAPSFVESARSSNGIYFNIKSPPDNDIAYFDIYRSKLDNADYDFVGRVPTAHSVTKFFDNSVMPGHEYHYKFYSVDFFENVSFSSFRMTASFVSSVERKGVLPPPSFTIKADSGKLVISGIKNHYDLLGQKIERMDMWKRDKNFSLKTNNSIEWPSINLFVDGKYTFEDSSVRPGRVYKYRITSLSKDMSNISYFVTPPIQMKESSSETLFSTTKFMPIVKTKIKSFKLFPLKVKQNPVVVKASWSIDGPWDHLIIEFDNKKFKVENIHEMAYLNNFNRGNSYSIKVVIRDENENILDEMSNIALKI